MMIRAYNENDLHKIHQLRNKYFPNLQMPSFEKMLVSFIIEDDKGIILAGCLKPIAEIMLITNKARSARTRVEALHEAKIASMFGCMKFEIKEAIAFTKDEIYKEQLIRNGFENIGEGLSIKVEHG